MSRASEFSGKVALITGGASGIGAAMSTKLVESGAEVWIADRQIAVAEQLAQRLNGKNGTSHAIEVDVRVYSSVESAVAQVMAHSGRIDYLFNNAGIAVGGEVDSYDLDDWNDVLDVNLRGIVHGVHAVYPIMIKQGHGHIVNTASMAGLIAGPGVAGYSTSKHAIVGLSKALRVEAKRHGVQVSVLCPGVIQTPMLTGGAYGRGKSSANGDGSPFSLPKILKPMEPERFAERTLRAVARGEAIIVVPGSSKLAWYLERISPGLSMSIMGAVTKPT